MLSNLTALWLNDNQIVDLTPLFKLLEKGLSIIFEYDGVKKQYVVIGDNPLQHPPLSIVEQGTEAVLTYFRNLEEQGESRLNIRR